MLGYKLVVVKEEVVIEQWKGASYIRVGEGAQWPPPAPAAITSARSYRSMRQLPGARNCAP